jgi:hypothetical protein
MKNKLAYLFGILILLLCACQPAAHTPQNQKLAEEKIQALKDSGNMGVSSTIVYRIPGMENVKLVNYTYTNDLTLDIYYPPDYQFKDKLPVVLIVSSVDETGREYPMKETGQFISWGQAIAASGMAAVLYEAHDPAANFIALLKYLNENADQLVIDPTRMLLMSFGEPVPYMIWLLDDPPFTESYQKNIRGLILYYGDPDPTDAKNIPPGARVFATDCGNNYHMNRDIDGFVTNAKNLGIEVEYVHLDKVPMYFDFGMVTDESTQIIQKTFAFMKKTFETE